MTTFKKQAFFGGGGSGSSTFLGLTDTPSAFTDKGLYDVRVNSGADAVEFVQACQSLYQGLGYSFATSFVGGGTGALDAVDVSSLSAGDRL